MEMRNIVENNMVEEIDGGNFFDHIDDLLEFPNDDDVETGIFGHGGGCGGGDGCDFTPVWSEEESGFSAGHCHSASDLSAELAVPYEDIVQLEWLSTFVEDSFSGVGLTLDKSYTTSSDNKDSFQTQFHTSSPVSVLESSTSASSRSNILPVSHEKRARSKRPRPPTFIPRAPFELTSPAPIPVSSSESGNFTVSKKQKSKIPPLPGNQDETRENPMAPVRKCKHCEITKTPQWRTGPMGPKSLCNACGVRYKSGRLYPEYRPAASPTFVPAIHSNSHKKVLEMRGCVPAPPSQKINVITKNNPVEPYM